MGAIRDDVNHINALLVSSDFLYIGLNNLGLKPAGLLRLPFVELHEALKTNPEIDISKLAEHTEFNTVSYTHDLEPDAHGRLFACASHEGVIFDVANERPLLKAGDWARGLAFDSESLWVGNSKIAGRRQRHSEKLDGTISRYALPDFKLVDQLTLHKAGQVNDLLHVKNCPIPSPEQTQKTDSKSQMNNI